MSKTHGFGTEVEVAEHVAPVMFHPENVHPAAGVAVIFTACPTGSRHPDGHKGLTVPSPTTVVVKAGHVVWEQAIVTVSTFACLANP
jgi:hypothetical protein